MATLDPIDAALAASLGVDDADADDLVDVEELAAAAETPVAVIEAIHREGLLVARQEDPLRFAPGDADTIRAAMAMLMTGLPLAEFLDLARRADQSLRALADQSVETFLRYVRDPVRGSTDDPDQAADELVEAFQQMLPAVRGLVGGHFEALVLDAARTRLGQALADAGAAPNDADDHDADDHQRDEDDRSGTAVTA